MRARGARAFAYDSTHGDRPLPHHVQAKMSAVRFQTVMPAQPSAQHQ
jgi:hypothetical protein